VYDEILSDLREAYNHKVIERDNMEIAEWKIAERQHFLDMLRVEQHHPGRLSLLEIGAGTGRDSLFFQEYGLKVVCTDLSPEMVALCRTKGLDAHVMDFLHLDFPPQSFDAIYALNCLLHVPKKTLPAVLEAIKRLLKPSGLFFLGVYGGHDFEGERLLDDYIPKRFFSFYTDEGIQQVASKTFEIVYFKPIMMSPDSPRHFQSMILKP
jgi:SAM-dependent methyltransferase